MLDNGDKRSKSIDTSKSLPPFSHLRALASFRPSRVDSIFDEWRKRKISQFERTIESRRVSRNSLIGSNLIRMRGAGRVGR